MRPPILRALALAVLGLATPSPMAHAESALRLDPPVVFGVIPAATYDVERRQVGGAKLSVERLPDGSVSLRSLSGFTGGARTLLYSLLEPVDGGAKLRPVEQESRSFDPDGKALGILRIDHRAGFGRCFDSEGTQQAELALPAEDRVANVTLNLLFRPLVLRETEEVRFDLFFCGLGTRFVTFSANLAPESRNGRTHNALEVRYGPDFGVASFLARSVVPKLSIWYGGEAPYRWVAHRLPLYGGGPEVFVVRKGIPTRWFGDD